MTHIRSQQIVNFGYPQPNGTILYQDKLYKWQPKVKLSKTYTIVGIHLDDEHHCDQCYNAPSAYIIQNTKEYDTWESCEDCLKELEEQIGESIKFKGKCNIM